MVAAPLHIAPGILLWRERLNRAAQEALLADVMARGLRAESFAVDVAYDGPGGWEMAAGIHYDLIILDLMLPGLSGT